MARKTATGPAAYHARIEAEKIAALESQVAALKAQLTGWVSPYQQQQSLRDAVKRTYETAHRDGYNAGWSDKACGILPHKYPDAA